HDSYLRYGPETRLQFWEQGFRAFAAVGRKEIDLFDHRQTLANARQIAAQLSVGCVLTFTARYGSKVAKLLGQQTLVLFARLVKERAQALVAGALEQAGVEY